MKFINMSLSANSDWQSDTHMDHLLEKRNLIFFRPEIWPLLYFTSTWLVVGAGVVWYTPLNAYPAMDPDGVCLDVPIQSANSCPPAGLALVGGRHMCVVIGGHQRGLSREREGRPVRPMRTHCFLATMQPSAAMLETSAHSQGGC